MLHERGQFLRSRYRPFGVDRLGQTVEPSHGGHLLPSLVEPTSFGLSAAAFRVLSRYVTIRPQVLFVPQIPERRASSWTTWEWSTKRFTSGPKFLTYQVNTSGSAASNITFSSPSSFTIFATTSVRQLRTFSVIPSDSTMMR